MFISSAFTKKLNELQETGGLAPLNSAIGAAVAEANSTNQLSALSPKVPSIFAEYCQQVAQQQNTLSDNAASILLSIGASASEPHANPGMNLLTSLSSASDVASSNLLQNAVSVALAPGLVPSSSKDSTSVQLSNGLRFEITTNNDGSHIPLLRLLGIESPLFEHLPTKPENLPSSLDSSSWPYQNQLINPTDFPVRDSHLLGSISPRGDDTRPSSIDNGYDQGDFGRPIRSSSSLSSGSSLSQSNGSPRKSSIEVKDGRLDPTEQSRMRLERKRARNRDAARKCRERKIRLIKNLERDVRTLTEENEALRTRISKSKVEVENLRMFVVKHLENECPAIANKVA